MNVNERKARFTEIMTTIDLLPDEESGLTPEKPYDDEWVFPNKTIGFDDVPLANAISVEVMKLPQPQQQKMLTVLTNSAMIELHDMSERGLKPEQHTIIALGLLCNISWAVGHAQGVYSAGNALLNICAQLDIEPPELVYAPLRPRRGVDKLANLNSISILEGKVTPQDVRDLFQ